MKALALWLCLVGVAHAEPAWWTWAPLSNPTVPGLKPMLQDLETHCFNPGVYHDSDVTITAHELTHACNSAIRQRMTGCNGFYVLNNRCMVFHEPHCTLADVANRCKWHGPLFNQVMIQQQHGLGGAAGWQQQPLYVLDEMVAYTHGSIMGALIGDRDNRFDIAHAREMSFYAHTLVATIRELDPGYVDLDKLAEFISWNDDRIDSIGEKL